MRRPLDVRSCSQQSRTPQRLRIRPPKLGRYPRNERLGTVPAHGKDLPSHNVYYDVMPLDYLAENRKTWDRWARVNYDSTFYGVDEWKAGRSVRPGLDALESRLLGEVADKTLLHLQCHFGLDTLTQARRGARVVGVDFSSEAIARARALAKDIGIAAEFVESDVYRLPEVLDRAFDIVLTSIGVLNWLPDLERWAQVIVRFLAPGGRFVLLEAHPTALLLDEDAPAGSLVARHPYFAAPEPLRFEQRGCYSDRDADIESVLYEWPHPLSEILGSLLAAGLAIESLEEHPFIAWPLLPWMVERPDGCFELPRDCQPLPLMFSIVARRGADK